MLAHPTQRDITGTVNLEDSRAVADACVTVLAARYGAPAIDARLLAAAFENVRRAYWGLDPDYLPCDTPYHDLRHAFDTALLTARLLDGYEAAHAHAGRPGLGPAVATLAVLLGLMHDTGFLRRVDEPPGPGARLLADHEARSVLFAQRYLAQTPHAAWADRAVLIESTSFGRDPDAAARGHPPPYLTVAQILGTADLLAQLADRDYLEKCYHHLYAEFVVAGLARPPDQPADRDYAYDSPADLLRSTPAFIAQVVRPRLDHDFARCHAYLASHFGGNDPYMASIASNLQHLDAMIARDDFSRLRRRPRPVLPPPHDR